MVNVAGLGVSIAWSVGNCMVPYERSRGRDSCCWNGESASDLPDDL